MPSSASPAKGVTYLIAGSNRCEFLALVPLAAWLPRHERRRGRGFEPAKSYARQFYVEVSHTCITRKGELKKKFAGSRRNSNFLRRSIQTELLHALGE